MFRFVIRVSFCHLTLPARQLPDRARTNDAAHRADRRPGRSGRRTEQEPPTRRTGILQRESTRIHGQDTAPAAPGPSPAGETFDDFDDSTAVVPLPWPTFANWPEIIPSGGGHPAMARPGVDFDAVNTPGFVVVGRCG
jgi:hypothetical protein